MNLQDQPRGEPPGEAQNGLAARRRGEARGEPEQQRRREQEEIGVPESVREARVPEAPDEERRGGDAQEGFGRQPRERPIEEPGPEGGEQHHPRRARHGAAREEVGDRHEIEGAAARQRDLLPRSNRTVRREVPAPSDRDRAVIQASLVEAKMTAAGKHPKTQERPRRDLREVDDRRAGWGQP